MMFKIKMFAWIYVWVGILLTCVKHMLDSFTSLKGDIWVHKTGLTPPLLMEVPVPTLECN